MQSRILLDVPFFTGVEDCGFSCNGRVGFIAYRPPMSLPDDLLAAWAELQVREMEEYVERLTELIAEAEQNHRAAEMAKQLLLTFEERLRVARIHLRLACELRDARGPKDQA